MDFLNQATGQVRELLQSMTPAGRVTAALLLGVIVVSVGYLFQHQSAGPDEYLFNGEFLPGRDVDRAEAAIAQAKLSGYQRIGNRIKVPAGQKAEYLAAVADAGALPPNFHNLLEEALNLGPFVDPETRRQRLKAAREQQLSMIIRAMEGIEEAHVIYDMQKRSGLSRTNQVTATVSVEPTPGEAIDARRIKMIKKAVAGAIVGLSADEVMIANLGDPEALGGGDMAALFDEPYYKAKLAYERHIKRNIENLLSYIPGIRVEVTAELDKAIELTTQTKEPAGDPVPLMETRQNQTTEKTQSAPAGRVGPYANGPGGAGETANAKQVVDKSTVENTETQNKLGDKLSVLKESGLVPEEVRAGISIPQDYLIELWRDSKRRKGEEADGPLPADIDTQLANISKNVTDKVKQVVGPLLPRELAEDPLKGVEVTFFENLPAAPIPETPITSKAMTWVSGNFNTITMGGIALVGLLMLRSLVKEIPQAEPVDSVRPATLPIDFGKQTVESAKESGGGTGSGAVATEEPERPRLKLKKGPNLKDDLTEIVREDPDAAAAILKSWISSAG